MILSPKLEFNKTQMLKSSNIKYQVIKFAPKTQEKSRILYYKFYKSQIVKISINSLW